MTILIIVASTANLVYLRRENRRKAAVRASGKSDIDAASWATEGDRHAHYIYSY